MNGFNITITLNQYDIKYMIYQYILLHTISKAPPEKPESEDFTEHVAFEKKFEQYEVLTQTITILHMYIYSKGGVYINLDCKHDHMILNTVT